MAESLVKKWSLWKVACASSDVFSDFLPITLVGRPLVKAIAFLLQCQIYSGLSAFLSPTPLPGNGLLISSTRSDGPGLSQTVLPLCPLPRKFVSAVRLYLRSMC